MKSNIDYKLYLVTDRGVLKGRDLAAAVESAIKGGVTLVQLREKDISTLDFHKVALDVKAITRKYNIPLIINDRIDIALSVDAEGIHVGQDDMPCTVTRELIGENKIVGVSVSTLEEAIQAEKDGADYIGVGAIFPTSSKDDAKSVSIEVLKKIKETISIPVVAIGGISSKNVSLLKPANIEGVAVISDILSKEDITKAAKELKELI
ncbi:thiamine phosphate synthase [Clostridium manihotivorum]|uniref:Thiamine-phosphate synthase n=1 Tax=Clostridium manihotivorum TaxID=2320868 RepID=A0A410DXC6_9CLOT|nr:thiamine phosphate synthase [Clostridium manihotivorum]QAA33650.1 thiamine phosphate synthase [Clostridium manihotivorum]